MPKLQRLNFIAVWTSVFASSYKAYNEKAQVLDSRNCSYLTLRSVIPDFSEAVCSVNRKQIISLR